MKRLIRFNLRSSKLFSAALRFSNKNNDIGSESLPSVGNNTEKKAISKPKSKKILNYILNPERKTTAFPRFDELKEADILSFSKYSVNLQIASPFRWTPLLQYHEPSKEFFHKMREFSLIPTWSVEHTGELIDAQIFEALRDTGYDYYYDYSCLPSRRCQYHGNIDFLIYNKKNETSRLPMVPVVIAKRGFNKEYKINYDDFNIAEIVGVGIWTLENSISGDKNITHVRVLHTNGNIWRMFEFGKDGSFRKTGEYVPRNQFKKIYHDQEMQQIVLGLIRYATGVQTEGEKKLNEVYSFIEEKKYLTEYDDDTKAHIAKQKRFWWFLPQRIREFFFS